MWAKQISLITWFCKLASFTVDNAGIHYVAIGTANYMAVEVEFIKNEIVLFVEVKAHEELPARSRANLQWSFEFPGVGRAKLMHDPMKKLLWDTTRGRKWDVNPMHLTTHSTLHTPQNTCVQVNFPCDWREAHDM